MSGLAKPLIHSTSTIDPADPINVDEIQSMTKISAALSNVNNRETYHIDFAMRGHNQNVRNIVWKFPDEASRDATWDAILVLASTLV